MKEKMIQLITETLNVDRDKISEEMSIDDIPEWDSMMFVMILAELEDKLNISIPIEEAIEMELVSELLAYAKE